MNDDRYARQTRFAPFGLHGHEKLRSASVAIVGLGGLGATLAVHLTRSGVGSLRLIDRDVVEPSNLPRQLLYTAEDAHERRPKAAAAADRLAATRSETTLEPVLRDLTARTADELLSGVDLILDGLDNFEGRYLLNDWCHRHEVPWIYGGAVGSEGRVLAIPAHGGPCLRCVFGPEPESPLPTCDTAGVLTPVPSMVASLQVAEAFRHLAEPREHPILWTWDAWSGRTAAMTIRHSAADCPCCTQGRYPALDRPASTTTTLCGNGTVQIHPLEGRKVDLEAIARDWSGLGTVDQTPWLVRLRTGTIQLSLFPDGRCLIQGIETAEEARSLYARYVGT